MGTYMSAFIETDQGVASSPFSDSERIFTITEGSFVFGKDYEVFDALAGGRKAGMRPEDRDPTREPKFQPRGMPDPRSLVVAQSFFYLVCDPEELPDRHFWPHARCVPRSEAENWVRIKGCVESEVIQTFNTRGAGLLRWHVVPDPVCYNASWLWPHEYEEALQHHGLDLESLPVEYLILRNVMELLERKHGREKVRLVIWFS